MTRARFCLADTLQVRQMAVGREPRLSAHVFELARNVATIRRAAFASTISDDLAESARAVATWR